MQGFYVWHFFVRQIWNTHMKILVSVCKEFKIGLIYMLSIWQPIWALSLRGKGQEKQLLEYFEFGLAATILTASCQYYIAYCTFCLKKTIVMFWNECGKSKYSKPEMDLHKLRNWFSSELHKKELKCFCKMQLKNYCLLSLLT